MVDQILSYFTFSIVELIGVALFLILLFIQLFYYFTYYKKAYEYAKGLNSESLSGNFKPKVSIIIVSENEVDSLAENLPAILDQDYPDFEVIVVNNGSTDESDTLLRSLELKYPRLYHTFLPYSNDKMLGRYKLSMTLGVKAAKGDILLFTQPYSKPVSNKWISSMVGGFSNEKNIVLGYSFYRKESGFFNRLARFDNHIFSMQYLSMTIKGCPYTGVFRNIAFRKHLFFENKGFASILHLDGAEEILISELITPHNVTVSLYPDSFVETQLCDFSLWKQIKKSYSLSKTYFKTKASLVFGGEYFTRSIFYILFLLLIIYSAILQQWALLGISLLIFLIRYCVQLAIIPKSARYFMSGKFVFSLPILDFLQPYSNIRFKNRHRGRSRLK